MSPNIHTHTFFFFMRPNHSPPGLLMRLNVRWRWWLNVCWYQAGPKPGTNPEVTADEECVWCVWRNHPSKISHDRSQEIPIALGQQYASHTWACVQNVLLGCNKHHEVTYCDAGPIWAGSDMLGLLSSSPCNKQTNHTTISLTITASVITAVPALLSAWGQLSRRLWFLRSYFVFSVRLSRLLR